LYEEPRDDALSWRDVGRNRNEVME
jgi:hypothetical protein